MSFPCCWGAGPGRYYQAAGEMSFPRCWGTGRGYVIPILLGSRSWEILPSCWVDVIPTLLGNWSGICHSHAAGELVRGDISKLLESWSGEISFPRCFGAGLGSYHSHVWKGAWRQSNYHLFQWEKLKYCLHQKFLIFFFKNSECKYILRWNFPIYVFNIF